MKNFMTRTAVKPAHNGLASDRTRALSGTRAPAVLYYGLLLAIVFEYIRPATYFPFFNAVKLNTLIPVAAFGIAAFSNRSLRNADIFKDSNTKWLIFFLLLVSVSIFTADVTFNSYSIFKQVLGYYLLFFVIVKAGGDIDRLKGLFITLTLTHVLLAALNPKLILEPETRHYIENVTFLGDGNDFALSVGIVIPFTIFLMQEADGFLKKLAFTLMLIVLVMCVIGTSSRGASLALAAAMLYMWIKSRRKALGLAILVGLVVSVLAYAPDTYFERMESIKNYETEGSAKGRLMAWGSAVKMAADNPLLGVGAGHFAIKFGTEYRPDGFGRADLPWSTAHSIYFLILGELGLPGIVFLLAIISGNLLRNEKRMKTLGLSLDGAVVTHRRLLVCLNSSLISFAVAGAFLSAIYYPHLYVLAGMFAAYRFHMGKPLAPPA